MLNETRSTSYNAPLTLHSAPSTAMSASNGALSRTTSAKRGHGAGPTPQTIAGDGPVCIRQAAAPADIAAVRECFQAYTEWLNEDISFQDYTAELDGLPGKYTPPSGALLLAVDPSGHQVLGCIAMRPVQLKPAYLCNRKAGVKVCEMKRLFVYPQARGRRIASALVRRAVALARKAGHDEIVLDTMARMQPAINLYESEGFVRTTPYYFNPLPGVLYFTKDMQQKRPMSDNSTSEENSILERIHVSD